ncbi:MAG: hypothetical protein WBY94_08810 [Polyangiaceae bacterium]
MAGCRSKVRIAIAAVVGFMLIAAGPAGRAQSRRPASAGPARSRGPAHAPPKEPPLAADPQPAVQGTAAATPGTGTANDAGVVEAKTLDGGTRVFKFSEIDIEGRLKSPQLVYFLRRVRAEFAAGDLGHRSFLREMSETRREPTF